MNFMMRIFALLGFLIVFTGSFAQEETLMTINDKSITEGEFTRIFEKNNNTGNVVDKKSVEEYLDLFINFKLKVVEAESRGMDTLPKFKSELKGYKNQLEKPYFTDKSTDEKLVKEAFDRQQFDVRASHILIMVTKDATPSDTLAAYNKINNIRNLIVNGKQDFNKVAMKNSEDPSAKQNGGDLGYFTVFQMVYPFENAAYNTPVGEVSDIVRTRYGYHILKVDDKRKAKGEVKVAHIMVATPKGSDEASLKKSEEKIKMIYGKLKSGEEFKSLAQLYSDDKASSRNGGELQWFGTNHMVPEFENASFSLKEKGSYSEPVKTAFGWHIIKLIDKKEPKTYEESEKYLKKKISNDMRSRMSKVVVFDKIRTDYGFKLNKPRLNDFVRVIDKSIFEGNWDKAQVKKLNKTLFVLNDSSYNQQAFADFLEKNTQGKRKDSGVKDFVHKMFRLFEEQELSRVEKDNLANKYPEYRYLLQEYHDGILLFDLTDQEVWSKAIQDSLGLVNFYETNKNNYMWGQRVEAEVYSCKTPKDVKSLSKKLKKKASKGYTEEYLLMALNKKDSMAVELVKKSIFSEGDYAIVDEANKDFKFFSSENGKFPIIYTKDNKVVYVNKILNKQNKQLEEAKGQITADYQDFLEKQWVKELRKKYPVELNKEVWENIKKKY
jgi:peptidyl-prolyl cis-trans isomerase SurA